MAQTATAWSTEHALNVHNVANKSTLSVHSAITKISGNAELPFLDLDSDLADGKFYRPTSKLKYSDRVKISFAVADAYRNDFITIKGLLEFHRTPDLVFSYNKSEGSFDVTTAWLDHKELFKFLRKISVWLDQELSFKRQLKEMMAFEREYRARMATVYAGGDGFTLLRTV